MSTAAERIGKLIESKATSVQEFVNIVTVDGEPQRLVLDDLRELVALAGAEQLVRDRISRTKWASDARLLRITANEIHALGDPR